MYYLFIYLIFILITVFIFIYSNCIFLIYSCFIIFYLIAFNELIPLIILLLYGSETLKCGE